MIGAFAVLLGLQLIGEVIVRALHLPVPGPVLGMLILLGVFIWRGGVPEFLKTTGQGLLQNMSLFFVPAGVGVMLYAKLLEQEWLGLLLTLLGSTWVTLIVTALVLNALLKRGADAENG